MSIVLRRPFSLTPTPTVVYQHDFTNDADRSPIGSPWVNSIGAYKIASGVMRSYTSGNYGVAACYLDAGSAYQDFTLDISLATNDSDGSYIKTYVEMSSDGAGMQQQVELRAAGGALLFAAPSDDSTSYGSQVSVSDSRIVPGARVTLRFVTTKSGDLGYAIGTDALTYLGRNTGTHSTGTRAVVQSLNGNGATYSDAQIHAVTLKNSA